MAKPDSYPDPPTAVPTVEPSTLAQQLATGAAVRILDVRDRDEYDAWRIDGPTVEPTHVPYAKFMAAEVRDSVPDLAADIGGDGPITVVCGEGKASAYVAGLLIDAGFEARNLAGGMAAWAGVYESEVVRSGAVTVLQYHRPSSGCLAYTVISGGEAVVVDPLRAFADRYATDAADRDADVVAVVDTHVHADHVSGLHALAEGTGARRIVPARSVDRGLDFDADTVADGDPIPVGETRLTAVSLPGHTTDMTGFAVDDVLLSGDSLFIDGVARPDLQDGTDPAALAAELYATLTERLDRFDDDTLLAPGHYDERTTPDDAGAYTASLGAARNRSPAADRTRDAFVERMTENRPPEPANAAKIVAINRGRETAVDPFELELGPNNCAAAPVGE